MLKDPDYVRLQGKTGSSAQTANVTRLTPKRRLTRLLFRAVAIRHRSFDGLRRFGRDRACLRQLNYWLYHFYALDL